jgi:hypothetical protein
VGNDDIVSAFDNKTIQVTPSVSPRRSSAKSQVFTVSAPDTPAATFFVTDALAPVINATNDFVVRIPAAFNVEWDTSIVNVSVGGSAASKVSTTVSYADSRTLVVNVTTNFGNGDFVSVSGLEFRTFSNPSPAANLELVVNSSTYFDDKTIEVSALSDVPFFSATATGVGELEPRRHRHPLTVHALDAPGTTNVFVGSSNGKLYQIEVNTPLPVKSITLGSGAEAVRRAHVRSPRAHALRRHGRGGHLRHPLPAAVEDRQARARERFRFRKALPRESPTGHSSARWVSACEDQILHSRRRWSGLAKR